MSKLNGNQKSFLNKNISKRYSPVGKIAILGLILLALSSCTPNKTETKSATISNNDLIQTATQIQPEVQVEPQLEVKYSEAEIKKGAEKVNENIALYESEFRQDGKTKKSPVELSNSKYVASVLKGLDTNSLGKYADRFEIKTYKTLNSSMIRINDEIIDCEKDFMNVTTEVNKGLKNVKAEIERLVSNTTEDGKIKTNDEMKIDKDTASVVESYYTSKETEDQISFLFNVSEKFEVKSLFLDDITIVVANSNDSKVCLLYKELVKYKGWVDFTEKYQLSLDKKQRFDNMKNLEKTETVETSGPNSVQTATQIQPEVQVEPQLEVKYSEAEIKKGAEKVNENIALYESEFIPDGKTKKNPTELSNEKYFASVLKGLDRNSLGKYADRFEIKIYKTSNYGLIIINNEIIDCEKDFINVTTEVSKGLENVKAEIARLESSTTKDGKIKTKEEIVLDKYASLSLKNYYASKENDKQISFLFNVSEKCEIESFSNDITYVVSVNSNDGIICLSSTQYDDIKGWYDNTEEYQEEINHKEMKKKYNKILENKEPLELGQ